MSMCSAKMIVKWFWKTIAGSATAIRSPNSDCTNVHKKLRLPFNRWKPEFLFVFSCLLVFRHPVADADLGADIDWFRRILLQLSSNICHVDA